jgi:hypothetical protein
MKALIAVVSPSQANTGKVISLEMIEKIQQQPNSLSRQMESEQLCSSTYALKYIG